MSFSTDILDDLSRKMRVIHFGKETSVGEDPWRKITGRIKLKVEVGEIMGMKGFEEAKKHLEL